MPAGFDGNFAGDLARYLAVVAITGLLIVGEWAIAIKFTPEPPRVRGAILLDRR
jgi:hypothetical protein